MIIIFDAIIFLYSQWSKQIIYFGNTTKKSRTKVSLHHVNRIAVDVVNLITLYNMFSLL